jgi:predicted nucleic acid-binding protein
LVPLIVAQTGSPDADRWLSDDPAVVLWTLSAVELASAIRRLVREGLLGEQEANAAETRADELIESSHTIVNVEAVKAQARRLLRLHSLRAADAMQLGAALEWAGGRPAGRFFMTLDSQLARAAAREGFRVVPDAARSAR